MQLFSPGHGLRLLSRTLAMAATVVSVTLSFGCSSVKFSPVPDPFSRDMIIDKVIKEIVGILE